VQHALRAYTPKEQKAVRMAAESFRANPDFSTAEVITQLGIGEALVSVLEDKGVPSIVGRTLIRPPSGQVGPLTPEERQAVIASSPVAGQYDTVIDRESAYEVLTRKAAERMEAEAAKKQAEAEAKAAAERAKAERAAQPRRSTRQTPVEAAINSFSRTMASNLGKALVRGILGGLTRGR
jgi:DNA helicase HerA-like ATPase